MRYNFDESPEAIFRLSIREPQLERQFFKERNEQLLAIAWNRGAPQTVTIDNARIQFPTDFVLTLMVNQSFRFDGPEDVVLWQFNRNFYCIVDHDREVSCVGFLFYGSGGSMLVRLDETARRSFDLLLQVFEEEFMETDSIQGEMLRVLLKRLIIKMTRLAKKQFLSEGTSQPALDLVRQFNLLVENNFKQLHQVQDYAQLLHKSPKTLSNLFALNGQPSPLQTILDRVALEAQRLLLFTDKTGGEIADELGFEELAHFSRFFKKATGQTPSEFKAAQKNGFGKNR